MRTCTVDGCARPFLARGYCNAHYQRWKDGKPLDVPVRQRAPRVRCKGTVCRQSGCPFPAVRKGLCAGHWRRYLRDPGLVSGPLRPRAGRPLAEPLVHLSQTLVPVWVREELDAAVAATGGRLGMADVVRQWLGEKAQAARAAREEAQRREALHRLDFGPQKRGPKGPRRAA